MKGIILANEMIIKLVESGNLPEDIKVAVDLFKDLNLDVKLVDYKKVKVTVDNEDSGKIIIDGEEVDLPDFAFHVSIFNRDDYYLKAVKRMFETAGCQYINSFETAEIVEDKLYSMQLAKSLVPEVKIPKTLLINENTLPSEVENYLGFPCVVKIMNGLQGKGVSLINNADELKTLLDMLFASTNSNHYIAQEAIMTSKGRDLRIALANGELLYSFVRVNDKDFKSNTHMNGRIEDYEPSSKLLDLSRKLAEALNLKYGSIDFLFGEDEDEFYLCEFNTFPGFSRILEAVNNNDTEFLDKLKSALLNLIE